MGPRVLLRRRGEVEGGGDAADSVEGGGDVWGRDDSPPAARLVHEPQGKAQVWDAQSVDEWIDAQLDNH